MSRNNKQAKINESYVKVSETYSKFVGKGMALLDPKVMGEMGLSTGDIIEISGRRRSMLCYGQDNPTIMGGISLG